MAKKTSIRSTKGKVKQAKEEKRGVGKKKYKVRNWSDYNEELKQRGSIEVWVEKGLAEVWYEDKPTGKPGSPKNYSDKAIVAILQFGVVFHQKLRQTEGLVGSIFRLWEWIWIFQIILPCPEEVTVWWLNCRRPLENVS